MPLWRLTTSTNGAVVLGQVRTFPGRRSASHSSPAITQEPQQLEVDKKLERRARELQEELRVSTAQTGLSSVEDSRVDMPPVAKDLFLGKFCTTILNYPDVLENDRYFALEKRCEKVQQHLKAQDLSTIDRERRIDEQITGPLRDLGLVGMRGHLHQGGQGLCYTETMKLMEELGDNSSLSETFANVNGYALTALQKCGSDEQIATYLPRLLSGEWTAAVCMADDFCGVDPTSTRTKAVFDTTTENYILSGTKTWVTNASKANLFLVFANLAGKEVAGVVGSHLTAFLVEKDSPGLVVSEQANKNPGMKGLDTGSVTLDSIQISPKYILGELGEGSQVYSEMVATDRCLGSAKVASILRKLLNNTMEYTMKRKIHGKALAEFDMTKYKISQMAIKLYTLEAMAYMTAGIGDVQTKEELIVESAMTKLYANEAAKFIVENCRTLWGTNAYAEDHPIHVMAADLHAMELWEGPSDLLKMIIGLEGIIHVGKAQGNTLSKLRIPQYNVWTLLGYRWRTRKIRNNKEHFPLKLENHVHQSLVKPAQDMETALLHLQYSVERAMIHHGLNIGIKEMDVIRLAEIATDVYAMASAVGRANRAYCHGHAHGDLELNLAFGAAFEAKRRITQWSEDVRTAFFSDPDNYGNMVGEYLLQEGKYVPAHPIDRTVF